MSVRRLFLTKRFQKSFERLRKAGLDPRLVEEVVTWIQNGYHPRAPTYRDHARRENLAGLRDLHIRGDLVLIYRIDGDCLRLENIGSHNQVFGR